MPRSLPSMSHNCDVSIIGISANCCCVDLPELISGSNASSFRLILQESFDFSDFPLGDNIVRSAIGSTSESNVCSPRIVRPNLIVGTRIAARSICLEDARFVVSLRLGSGRGQFLTDIDGSVDAQRRWLQEYLQDESQAYFVIHDVETSSPVGLVRMYGARGNFFSWGSWIFLPGCDSFFAFESAMLIYQYAFLLGFESAYFDVRRANVSVRRFHEKLGAVEVNSDSRDVFYEFYGPDIRAAFCKYSRFSPSRLKIYFA